MTLIDTQDMRDRTCDQCGCVIWDRQQHERWHRNVRIRFDALRACLVDLTDPFIEEED